MNGKTTLRWLIGVALGLALLAGVAGAGRPGADAVAGIQGSGRSGATLDHNGTIIVED